MAQEQNPFETWGGMPSLVPQQQPGVQPQAEQPYGGLQPGAEGSYFTLSPEAMQMMWAPPVQQVAPQIQPPPPPQVQQLPAP